AAAFGLAHVAGRQEVFSKGVGQAAHGGMVAAASTASAASPLR
ncbi:MAG: hypothetical protein ACI9EF_000578, partial [Pseudohongiellaceae bacterium]